MSERTFAATRRNRIRSRLSVLVLAATTLTAAPGWGREVGCPNVLFIAVDDLNDWVLGLNRGVCAETPNLDRLASEGVLFTRAYCAAPACNPSRVSVMTGLHPTTSGVYFNSQDWRENEALQNAVTIPAYFRARGYEVIGGGKLYHAANLSTAGLKGLIDPVPWHTFFPSKSRQLAYNFIPPGQAVNGSNDFYKGRFDWDQVEVADDETGDGQVVAWATRELSKKRDKPLFLGVGIYRPHIPWYTPKRWFDEYPLETIKLPTVRRDDLADVPAAGRAMARQPWQRWLVENDRWKNAVQAYLASVSFADEMVGRLLNALHEGPNAANTVVVLWSDHGYHLGHKEHWEKFALWEQATHVPLLITSPDANQAGESCDVPVSLIDIFPTLCELTNGPTPDGLDGVSLAHWLETEGSDSDRVVVTTQGRGNHAARSPRYRYIRYADGSEELYDHASDPSEFTNLARDPESVVVKQRLAKSLPVNEATASPTIPARPK